MRCGGRGRQGEQKALSANKPKPLAQVIRNWLKSSGLEKGLEKGRLIEEWESLVGPRISAVSTPIDVRGETLLLEVEDPVWRTEISMMQEMILEVIAGHPDLPKVHKIRLMGRRAGGIKK